MNKSTAIGNNLINMVTMESRTGINCQDCCDDTHHMISYTALSWMCGILFCCVLILGYVLVYPSKKYNNNCQWIKRNLKFKDSIRSKKHSFGKTSLQQEEKLKIDPEANKMEIFPIVPSAPVLDEEYFVYQ